MLGTHLKKCLHRNFQNNVLSNNLGILAQPNCIKLTMRGLQALKKTDDP